MISVDGLTVEFGGTTLFSDISFQINEKDRIALWKSNGSEGLRSGLPAPAPHDRGRQNRLRGGLDGFRTPARNGGGNRTDEQRTGCPYRL